MGRAIRSASGDLLKRIALSRMQDVEHLDAIGHDSVDDDVIGMNDYFTRAGHSAASIEYGSMAADSGAASIRFLSVRAAVGLRSAMYRIISNRSRRAV